MAAAVGLLAATGARADDPGGLRHEAERLKAANARIAARSQQVLLELYALESDLARAEREVAALRRRAAELDRRQASARYRLSIARRAFDEAERQLASRLRTLYIEGEVDPLAVLLGAGSLDEAITALDGLERLARQDHEIVAQVTATRAALASALRTLALRESELEALAAEAEAARASLAQARAERSSYLARLAAERRFNEREISQLLAQATAIEARAQALTAKTQSDVSASSAASSLSPPPLAAEPAEPGRTLTVLATGYSLRGHTATGMPVGPGIVAVDPRVIRLGTQMWIPGYGNGVAADTGSAVRGSVIDVWFPTVAQALAWGRRTVTITLY